MITSMRLEDLRPNDYNPNTMTKEEFAELVAEIRHLGRLPKPVVVRPDGDGHVIVDGEQSWRAAREAGLAEVACEVIAADDFEAMRQTYKRNQHGAHDPVLLGRMFRRMLEARGLSQRALAEEIIVSEGTVRNALAYAEAADLRNGYAFEQLSVRQVRAYVRLPRGIGDLWLDCGADLKVLYGAKEERDLDEVARQFAVHGGGMELENHLKEYAIFEKTDLIGYLKRQPRASSPAGFADAMKTLKAWYWWEHGWLHRIGREELRRYTRHYFEGAWPVRETWMMESALDLLIDATVRPPAFRLTPAEFTQVLADSGQHRESLDQFWRRLEVAVRRKTGGKLPESPRRVQQQLQEARLNEEAPDYIRRSQLPFDEKYALWQAATSIPDGQGGAVDITPIKRELARRKRIACRPKETVGQAIERAIGEVHRAATLKAKHRATTREDLARYIAKHFPLYDPLRGRGAVKRLAANLARLTKAELLLLHEHVERLQHLKEQTALLRQMFGVPEG